MNPRILFILRFIFGFSFVGIAVVQVLLLIKLITDSSNGGELPATDHFGEPAYSPDGSGGVCHLLHL